MGPDRHGPPPGQKIVRCSWQQVEIVLGSAILPSPLFRGWWNSRGWVVKWSRSYFFCKSRFVLKLQIHRSSDFVCSEAEGLRGLIQGFFRCGVQNPSTATVGFDGASSTSSQAGGLLWRDRRCRAVRPDGGFATEFCLR